MLLFLSITMKKAILTQRFRQDVYSIVAEIPYGKVLTYGQIAWLTGKPNHARHVGNALRKYAEPTHLPCHRVVNSQGRTSPIYHLQRSLLEAENIPFKSNGCVDLKKCQWDYEKEI